MPEIEIKCLAYRYLYYVKGVSLISDYNYDLLEKEALNNVSIDSMLNQPGSDLETSYSDEVKQYATNLCQKMH